MMRSSVLNLYKVVRRYRRRQESERSTAITTTTTTATATAMMNRSSAAAAAAASASTDVEAEVQAATSALVVDEKTRDEGDDNGLRCTDTYCLGELQDRELLVADDGVTIRSKSQQQKEVVFTKNRWAQFVSLLPCIDDEAKELNKQSRPVAFRQHIGDGYYVSVNDGFMCVDVRKYFLPYGMQRGDEKPTKRGIALRLDEWCELLKLVPLIHQMFPSLANALPCYAQGDHMNQLGWLDCTSCHPFGVPPY